MLTHISVRVKTKLIFFILNANSTFYIGFKLSLATGLLDGQFVRHCSRIAQVEGSNPTRLIFFIPDANSPSISFNDRVWSMHV